MGHNGVGKRVYSIENDEITKYLYDGLNAIIERNWRDDTVVYYTRGLSYGGGIGSIISAKRELPGGYFNPSLIRQQALSKTLYFHYDGLGSVTDLTGPYGAPMVSYTYDAYGNILGERGLDFGNPYRFSTKEHSLTSRLIYFGARYYDPEIGRFITSDPLTWGPDDVRLFKNFLAPNVPILQNTVVNKRGVIEPDTIITSNIQLPQLLKGIVLRIGALNPPMHHRYTYCRNNPVNSIDPYGLDEYEQLIKERDQLWLELMDRTFWFYVGVGGALIGIGIYVPFPCNVILIGTGVILEARAIYGFINWAQRWGDWYLRMRRYQERKVLGEEIGIWGYSPRSP